MKQVPETFPDNFLKGNMIKTDAACPQVTFMSIQRA